MGRPLKIAKAQALLTVTNTTAVTNIVTVSENLNAPPVGVGIIAGMPFIPSVTTGTNLVAGTTYWVLTVLGANTFTVSATHPSANPTFTPVTLTTGTTASVLSVGVVDSGFNNPDNSATSAPTGAGATFGVVGGNTGIYGKQVLGNVAFGINGTGTIYSDSTVAVVSGVGTDFGNNVPVNSWIGTDSSTNLGYVTSVGGLVTVTTVAAVALTDLIEVDDSTSLVLDGGIVFSGDIGGLTAGSVYYVKAAPDGTHISVSLTPGGTVLPLNDDTVVVTGTQDTLTLVASAASSVSGSAYVYATPEAGYITRQKGKTKYLATGVTTGITGAVFTANVANTALTPNTISIIGTYAGPSTKYMKTVNDYQSEAFPATVAASALVGSTVYTIYNTGTTDWTAVGASSNLTGITFTATGAGSGTGTAVLSTVNPDVISTFGTAYAANTYGGQPNPIVTIANS